MNWGFFVCRWAFRGRPYVLLERDDRLSGGKIADDTTPIPSGFRAHAEPEFEAILAPAEIACRGTGKLLIDVAPNFYTA